LIEIADADARQLLNALAKGEVVLVLGAGASATSTNAKGERIRQGSSLAELLANEAGLQYRGEDLSEVIGAVVGPRISAVQFHRILSEEYTKVTPSQELSDLLAYTWRRMYTWNVDDAVENVRGAVQRRRYFNGMIDKVVAHEGLSYLPVIHLHGEALKPDHGFIFGSSEYNARLNSNAHDWYREAAADYAAYTPLFIGSKLKEPILSAELDRARPNADAGLGRAFLVTPDEFSPVMEANLAARNICVIRATLAELIGWLKARTEKQVTPVDVAMRVNAFARELRDKLEVTASDMDVARTVVLHTWADTKRDADALQQADKRRLGRSYLEGAAPTWAIAATDIPVWLKGTDRLYDELAQAVLQRDRLFVVYGQSGSGKTTALLQSMLRFLNDEPNTPLYELTADTPSLRAALGLIGRIHRGEHVIIYVPDMFAFADSMFSDLTSFDQGRFTVISSARSGEWRDHIHRRVGGIARSFQYQRFEEADYQPLIQRLLDYVPAPRFLQMDGATRLQKLRSSRSQLLIALKETTDSAKFTNVITREFERLPDDDCRALVLLAGIATIARTGISEQMAREAYGLLRLKRTFDQAMLAVAGIVSAGPNGRLFARHELYVRHIFDNVANLAEIVDVIISILATFTKYKLPVVQNVDRLNGLLFKFLLNHNFNADLARRRGDVEAPERIYSTFEIAFQLDGHFWLQYGEYLVEKGELEAALGALNKSIQAYPNNRYAAHALADVQLKVAARRSDYDAVTVELIGEAVESLESQQSGYDIDDDQYPIVTLANHHVDALVRHRQDVAAVQAAKRYYSQLEDISKRNPSVQVQRARERLAHYLTSGTWQMVRSGRPATQRGIGRRPSSRRARNLGRRSASPPR